MPSAVVPCSRSSSVGHERPRTLPTIVPRDTFIHFRQGFGDGFLKKEFAPDQPMVSVKIGLLCENWLATHLFSFMNWVKLYLGFKLCEKSGLHVIFVISLSFSTIRRSLFCKSIITLRCYSGEYIDVVPRAYKCQVHWGNTF